MKKVSIQERVLSLSSLSSQQTEEDLLNEQFYSSKEYSRIKLQLRQREREKEREKGREREKERERETIKEKEADTLIGNVSNTQIKLKSAMKKPKTPGLGIGGEVHLPPLHVDDVNRVSDILHRVTLQSGIEPGFNRMIKTPANSLDKASHMGELQLKNMMESSAIKEILQEVLDVHNEIHNFAQSLGHRQAAAQRLDEANKLNLKLFQRIISEILMLHRQKFQSQTSQCSYLEEKVQSLENELNYYREDSATARHRIADLEFRCEELEQLCRTKDAASEMISTQLSHLQSTHDEYLQLLNLEKSEREAEQREQKSRLEQALREERASLLQQRHEMLQQIMRENELHHQSFLLQEEKKNRFKRPAHEPETKAVVETYNKETQTEVDDFGLWDKQNGWVLPLSGTIVARSLWRKACRYATCPNCKGIARFMVKAAVQFQKLQRGELDRDPSMVQYRLSGRWVLPNELVQFMTNLPRTIEGSKIWPLSRVIRYWWSMLALKMDADAEDDHHGYGIQKLPEFLIESFLLRTEHRQEAEIQMYHLMVSLREYVLVKKNAFLHTFARFLGTLDAPSQESSSLEEDDGAIKRSGPKGLLNQKGLIRTTSSSLSTGILTVYMFTRNCFLLPYRGEYANAIQISKQNSEIIQKNQSLLESPADDDDKQVDWIIRIPDHICTLEKFQMWIPLDRAVFVTRSVLHFLSEKQLTIMLKHIESMAMFLSSQGILEEPDGNHTVIRAAMRRFQDLTSESKTGNPPPTLAQSDCKTIVVNMDKLLQAIIELLLGRVKNLEDQLKKQFAEGDDNGDGVLSFPEFLRMMSKMAPNFPNRRILRMFREALMRGKDDAHIDQQSFVEVCKQHGLAQLVDIGTLKQTVLRELYPPDPVRKERKSSVMKPIREVLDSKLGARPPLSMAEVAIAASTIKRMLSRQSSQRKSSAMEEAGDESLCLRRNLSEEVQTSSKEISERILSALVTSDIRRIASDDHLPNLRKSAQILEEMKFDTGSNSQKMKGVIDNNTQTINQQLPSIQSKGGPPPIALAPQKLSIPINSSENSRPNPERKLLPTIISQSSIMSTEEDEDGQIVSLSSIRSKSKSQTPRITPQQTPKQTPRQTPRNPPKVLSSRLGNHLVNSADVLALKESESDESLEQNHPLIIDSNDPLTLLRPNGQAVSQILFGSDDPDFTDI